MAGGLRETSLTLDTCVGSGIQENFFLEFTIFKKYSAKYLGIFKNILICNGTLL